MSFRKAADLLRLAEMAGARHGGVSLGDIEAAFGVNRRTAQRMTRMLEQMFPEVSASHDEDRRKHWKLGSDGGRRLLAQGLREGELSALELAIRTMQHQGAADQARALEALRDRLLSSMPRPLARRLETDTGALLEAWGFAWRPGPRPRLAPELLGLVATALKGPHQMELAYRGARDGAPRLRRVEPHGVLLGTRWYLLAREVAAPAPAPPAAELGQWSATGATVTPPAATGAGQAPEGGDETVMRHFRLDRIAWARLLADSFRRDPGFDLNAHAARAFGAFHDQAEYGEVVWRFAPHAADVARAFAFHPLQQMQDEPDGSLVVRFHASGHLEMAWHLYQWGDAVEVIAPPALRALVAGHARGDFPALP